MKKVKLYFNEKRIIFILLQLKSSLLKKEFNEKSEVVF